MLLCSQVSENGVRAARSLPVHPAACRNLRSKPGAFRERSVGYFPCGGSARRRYRWDRSPRKDRSNPRPAAPPPPLPDGGDGGVEDDGDQSSGETIVVQVQSGHRAAGLQHESGVNEACQDAGQPAEMACDGSQSGAEQSGQLQGGVIGRIMHTVRAQGHADHDRDDVEGVLAEGGKAHDGEDSAHCGTIEFTAYNQNVNNPQNSVDADVDEHGPGAEHAQIVAGSPAGGSQQTPVAGPDGPGRDAGSIEAHQDHGGTQDAHYNDKHAVVMGGPVEHRVRFVAEGRQDRHDHHGKQSAGKSHVVEVHAVLNFIGIGGQRRQNKANQDAGQQAQRQAGVNAAQGHVADHGGQGGSQQGHGSIFGKRFSLVFGVQPRAQNDGPDVETVFSKQREAGHQAHFHNGKAVERIPGEFNDAHGEHGHNAGVDQSGRLHRQYKRSR